MKISAYIIAGLATLLALAVGALWVQHANHGRAIAQKDAQYSGLESLYAKASAAFSEKLRTAESKNNEAIEKIQKSASVDLQNAVARERVASDSRLRKLAADFAARSTNARPAPDDGSPRAPDAGGVLAHMLAESDELAEVYAATADRLKIALGACTRQYEVIRQSANSFSETPGL